VDLQGNKKKSSTGVELPEQEDISFLEMKKEFTSAPMESLVESEQTESVSRSTRSQPMAKSKSKKPSYDMAPRKGAVRKEAPSKNSGYDYDIPRKEAPMHDAKEKIPRK